MSESDAAKVPVVRHSRRLVAANRKWNVCFDHVSGDNGAEVCDYVVLLPKKARDDRVTGVTVIPVWDGRIALLRAYRHPIEAWTWEAPRGFIDPGETPEAAALRELAEETGLTTLADRLVPLGHCAPEAATIVGKGALYAALGCSTLDGLEGGGSDREELGLGALHRFTLKEALDLADNSLIEDATTLAALYRFARWQNGPSADGRQLLKP